MNAFTYKTWGIGDEKTTDKQIYDFNSIAAIHAIFKYYMPNLGEAFFNQLCNDGVFGDRPYVLAKDNCTVTMTNTTGPFKISIIWNK